MGPGKPMRISGRIDRGSVIASASSCGGGGTARCPSRLITRKHPVNLTVFEPLFTSKGVSALSWWD